MEQPEPERKDWLKILKTEYAHLKGRDEELTMLEHAGVDNWEWYDEALRGERDWD